MMPLTPERLLKYVGFEIRTPDKSLDGRGGTRNRYISTGKRISGALSTTNPTEQEKWRQLGHSVTHSLVYRPVNAELAPGMRDLLVTDDGRFFYVEWILNPGELGIYITLQLDQRRDLS